ncbi:MULTISPECIES: arylesterase [Silvimonas]|uniref:arylesterase n=1 Tax=Silvimonas TaxID=300264 RepID=UPI0024B35A87|nr:MULTISPECIES: arylesterase [Silvimonas]MDR3427187.1 arylesterase [Silvimonas sp.]
MRISFIVAALILFLSQAVYAVAPAPVILVFGDSLSAGYGLAADQAWPSLLQRDLAGTSKQYRVVNASVSGETTAGGLTRFPAALKAHQPKLVVLELGANDGLRGLPLDVAQHNLARMIELAQASGAKVHLVGMQLPPNFGPDYTQQFANMYSTLAKKYRTGLTPFLLAPVVMHPEMFQADQLHPTAAGQPLLAKQIQKDLAPLL